MKKLIELKRGRDSTALLFRNKTIFLTIPGLRPALFIGGGIFFLPRMKFLGRWAWAVRGCFPTFWSIGLRSCDGPYYGRVFGFRKAIAWNHWHLEKIMREWDAASDGPPSFGRITLLEYLRQPHFEGVDR